MIQLILLFHIIIAVVIVGLVLIQQGKGGGMGGAFGAGSSQAMFGSRGPASFLMKLTGGLAFLFFVTSLSLGYIASQQLKSQNQLAAPQFQARVPQSKPVSKNTASVPVFSPEKSKTPPARQPKK